MRILCAACHQTVELPPTVPPDRCPKCGATMAPPGYREPVILTERERVADPSYTPTLAEALRHPDAFVEGLTEAPAVLIGVDYGRGPDRAAVALVEYDNGGESIRVTEVTTDKDGGFVVGDTVASGLPGGVARLVAAGLGDSPRPAPRLPVIYECGDCRERFAWVPGTRDPFPGAGPWPCPKCGGRVREAAQRTAPALQPDPRPARDFSVGHAKTDAVPWTLGQMLPAPELVARSGLLADDLAYVAAGFPPACPVVTPVGDDGGNVVGYEQVTRAKLVKLTVLDGAEVGRVGYQLRPFREGDDPARIVYGLAVE